MSAVVQKRNREVLTLGQQVGELMSIPVLLLLYAFFAYHQVANTGFFTSRFGPFEMACFYGPLLLSVAAPLARAFIARRNPARPFEIATNLFLVLASLWLLQVFPFDITHFADALPAALRFLFTWMNNDIGRLILMLQILVGSLAALFTAGKYLAVRWHEQTLRS
jgi:uncharacterized membrane protein YhdT